jgi:hypothetical protein
MNIMTASGEVRMFYNPETPEFTEEHIKQVRELVNFINMKTIAGWDRKHPKMPEMDFAVELVNQVVLSNVPQVEHPTVYAKDRTKQ